MIPLVIGCPVYRRAWILDEYFDSLEAQEPPDGTRLIFALSTDEDGRDPDGTAKVIERRWPTAEIIEVPGIGFEDEHREHPDRFAYLANVRNRLLRVVALVSPEHYLSLDSDIILEPGALDALRAASRDQRVGDAVGALVDMGGAQRPGHWSWMMLSGHNAWRPPNQAEHPQFPHGLPFQAGVIMGCKLMSPVAYRNARYADHIDGEDVGWAIQCEAMGIQRWVAPAARGEHRWRV